MNIRNNTATSTQSSRTSTSEETPSPITESQLNEFKSAMSTVLAKHFSNHWHQESPAMGSGYRCLIFTPSKIDPLVFDAIAQATTTTSTTTNTNTNTNTNQNNTDKKGFANAFLSSELRLWIDPGDVSFKRGAAGRIQRIYPPVEQSVSPNPNTTLTTTVLASSTSATTSTTAQSNMNSVHQNFPRQQQFQSHFQQFISQPPVTHSPENSPTLMRGRAPEKAIKIVAPHNHINRASSTNSNSNQKSASINSQTYHPPPQLTAY